MKRFLTPVILCLLAFIGLANAQQGMLNLNEFSKIDKSVNPLATPTISLKIDQGLVQVESNATYKRVITMKNNTSKAVTFRLRMNPTLSMSPTQWKTQFEKDSYTLAAGATVTTFMDLNTYMAKSVGTYFLEAIDDNGKGLSDYPYTIAACKGVKYCFFTPDFNANLYVYAANVSVAQAMGPSAYATNFAAVPLIKEVLDIALTNDLEIAVFANNSYVDANNYIVADPNLFAQITPMATQLYSLGKNVILMSDFLNDPNIMNDANMAGITDEFLGTMQISNKSFTSITNGAKFNVSGVATDTVGSSMLVPLSFNTYKKSTYDAISGSQAKLVAYSDGKTDSSTIWRIEDGKGKMIFAPLNFSRTQLNGTRKFMDQAFNWFVGPKTILIPKISSNLSTLDFGVVSVGESRDSSFTILSTGTDTLFVSGWNYNIAGDSSFAIEFPAGGFKLAPGASQTIKARFTPKTQVKYTGKSINIINSDPSNMNYPIVFNGTGKKLLAKVPTITLSDTTVFFGLNSTITTNRELIFKNEGEPNLVIEPLVLSENTDNIFSIPTPDGFTLKGDSSKTIVIRMANLPNGEIKYYSAKLTIKSNDASRPEIKMLISVNKAPIGVEDVINIESLSLNVGPNPMSDNATITYSIDAKSARNINISIVDVSGNVVALLVNGEVVPGVYSLGFDASNLASGSYFIVAKTDDLTVTKALSIVK